MEREVVERVAVAEPERLEPLVERDAVAVVEREELEEALETLLTDEERFEVALDALEVVVERVAEAELERLAVAPSREVREAVAVLPVADRDDEEAASVAEREPVAWLREAVLRPLPATRSAEGRTLLLPKVRDVELAAAVRLAPAERATSLREGCKARALVTLRPLLRAWKLFSGCLTA